MSTTSGAAPVPIDPVLQQLSTPVPYENDDEWEYEYSTTESDTYYLTLDLTTDVSRVNYPAGRGASKPKWLHTSKSRRKLDTPTTLSLNDVGPEGLAVDGDDEDADEIEAENDEMDVDADDDADVAQDNNEEPMTSKEVASEVQILDLHTMNPLVSYKGHVYSCKWEENIGTDLLFTRHDPSSGLPILRSLPHELDLLGASAIRITSTTAVLEPTRQDRPVLADVLQMPLTTHDDPSSDFKIPVGAGANAERKEQAKFLEKLVALKKKKLEEDEVTIIAQKRFTNTGWRAQMNQKRTEERAELTEIANLGGPEAEQATYRLHEMDEEDAERAQEQRLRSAGLRDVRRPGRKPKSSSLAATDIDQRAPKRQRGSVARRPRGGNAAMNEHIRRRQQEMVNDEARASSLSSSLPTPQRWHDLPGNDRESSTAD